MKAKQIESACKDRSETQVGSQGPLLVVLFSCCPQQTWWLCFLSTDFFSIDFPIINVWPGKESQFGLNDKKV